MIQFLGAELNFGKVQSLGGDLTYYGRAIYLHILYFADGKTRLYVGQAYNLSHRINTQHADFRYRRDNASLHNYAVDRSVGDEFVILATLRERTERPELVLNLLECWMSFMFATLPESTMAEWLGSREEGEKTVFGLQLLKNAEDKMATAYFWDTRNGRLTPTPIIPVVTQGKDSLSKWLHITVGFGLGTLLAPLWWPFVKPVARWARAGRSRT